MEVEIRVATAADVASVLELWERAYPPDARRGGEREAVERLLAGDPGALLVATAGGVVVGSIVAGWDGWRGNLYRLAVDPDHRRRGIAARLVRAAEAWLRARGARRVTALVAREGPAARHVWESAGYAPDPARARWVRDL